MIWGTGSLGDSIEPFGAGFNKAYGLNVKFQFTPGPQMRDQAAKTIQEVQTGRALAEGAPMKDWARTQRIRTAAGAI